VTSTAASTTTLNPPRLQPALPLIIGIVLALVFGFLLTIHVIAPGITSAESFNKAFASANFPSALAINTLVGLSFLLFVIQTGRETLRVVFTVIAALIIGFLIMLVISTDPLKAYNTLLTGPVSRLNRWGQWIDDTMALILVGLAITLVFRARLFSLGAEGQIYLGAMAAGLVALSPIGLPVTLHIPLALLAGCAAGLLWGLIPAVLRAYLNANELVSTLMLNPIAALIYAMMLEPLKPRTAGYMVSADFPATALLPRIIPNTRVTTAIFFVVAAVIIVWLIIQRTPLGYEIRTVGANFRFARYGGVNTKRTIVLAMALSGILAGLTGGYLALAIHQKLILGISGGLAFEGIVVALLARNRPLAVPAMALMYSYLRVGGPLMQNDAKVSLEVVRVIQATIILLFTAEGLLAFLRWRRTPAPTAPVKSESTASVSENTIVQPQQ
jgi:simple sugar transport system permease protein